MDVIGTIGETLDLNFFDSEVFGFCSGAGIALYHTSRGPKDIIWRPHGVAATASLPKMQLMAVSPDVSGAAIEVIHFNTQQSKCMLHNPTAVKFHSLSFGQDGSTLFGLSSVTEHFLVGWDLAKCSVYFQLKLDAIFNQCRVNPCDNQSFLLSNDDFLYFGKCTEVLGEFLPTITPFASYTDRKSLKTSPDLFTDILQPIFLVWLPGNFALVSCDQSGSIYLVNCSDENVLLLGNITNPMEPKRNYIPLSATMSLNQLIVGTAHGDIFWYSINTGKLVNPSGGDSNLVTIIDFENPRQVLNSKNSVYKLEINSKFDTCIALSHGDVLQFPSEALDLAPVENDDTAGDGDVLTSILVPTLPSTSVKVQLEIQSGTVITACPCTVPLLKADKTLNLLNFFVTSIQNGSLAFWRLPFTASDKSLGKGNLHLFEKTASVDGDSKSFISSLTFSSRNLDRVPYLYIGTSEGFFEVMRINAYELDEDYESSHVRPIGTFEDEGSVIGLFLTTVFSVRLFYEPVTIVSINDTGSYLCCGSAHSSTAFVLKCGVASSLSVTSQVSVSSGSKEKIAAVQWADDSSTLWLISKEGSLRAFDSKSIVTPSSDHPQPIFAGTVNASKITYSLGQQSGGALLHTPDSYGFYKVQLPSKSDDKHFKQRALTCTEGILHGDMISYAALSPCKTLLASGCVDGHVYLWKLSNESISKSHLLNKVRLHREAVTLITFSSDSSSILSSASDGSIFILKTEKVNSEATQNNFVKPDAQVSERKEKSIKRDVKTWADIFEASSEAAIKSKYEGKIGIVMQSVDGVFKRINTLIELNGSRADAEKLERSEMVVDVDLERTVKEANLSEKERYVTEHELRNAYQDILAARIRASSYDLMEIKSTKLYPFSLDGSTASIAMSSFPVRELPPKEKRTLDRITRLRNIEILSQRGSPFGKIEKLRNGTVRSYWAPTAKGCPSDLTWVMHNGLRWPSAKYLSKEEQDLLRGKVDPNAPPKLEIVEEDDGDDTDGNSKDFDGKNIINLLHGPLCVRTQVQRRVQIVLLKSVDRIFREKFNAEFLKLRSEKEDAIVSIESRNVRMNEILSELHLRDSLVQPKFRNEEILGSLVTIHDSELTNIPYESEASRLAREREALERKKREEESNKQDTKGRALQDMMNGTLDVKKLISLGDTAVSKPAWMEETPLSEMTELQKKELEAFEDRQKQIVEEQLKYKKSLEQELKKLKAEVVDVCKLFDDKFAGGQKLRIQTLQEIISQDLYIAKLASSMVSREDLWSMYMNTRASMDQVKAHTKELRKKLSTMQAKVDDLKMHLNHSLEEEKTLDKGFKKDIQTLCNATFDQETLKVLFQLFRIRHSASGDAAPGEDDTYHGDGNDESRMVSRDSNAARDKSSKNSSSKMKSSMKGGDAGKNKASKMRPSKTAGSGESKVLGPMQEAARALKNAAESDTGLPSNPYELSRLIMSKQKRGELEAIINLPLRMEDDCPEGFNVDQFTWSKLQELRTAKIEREIATKSITEEYSLFKTQLDILRSEESALDKKMSSARDTRDQLKRKIDDLDNNLEILVSLRQGQDEVDTDNAMVADYTDAILIPIPVVARFNEQIRSLGKEKIAVLSKIKTFRRKINLVDWEAHHLRLLRQFYEEYFTDLQLLRVTKDLQQVLRDGSDENVLKSRTEKIFARKDLLQKDADAKLLKLMKTKEVLEKQLEERVVETSKLDVKISSLTSQVTSRKSIKQSRDVAKGASGNFASTAASKKMKAITTRRQLVDTARAQAEEIDYLRQELDKLRQKTFPSFVRATKTRTTAGL